MGIGKVAVLAGFGVAAMAVAIGGLQAIQGEAPAASPSYAAPPRPAPHPADTPPAPRYAMRQGHAFDYRVDMSPNDLAAGLATKSLVMIEFNGMVGGQYSFQTTNPVTGNLIIMKCAEPCEFMNVMNYDHRVPEVFPVTPDSLMAAIVADARGGFLNPSQ